MNNNNELTFGDLFAGGGGVTTGALSVPGLKVIWALNHSEVAIKSHAANHPETKHYQADIREQDEHELDRVDILWASLECTNFSNAKGGKPRDADSRTLAYELYRYAPHLNPAAIIVENVREFMAWGPLGKNGKPISRKKGKDYLKWIKKMKALGWVNYECRLLNAADFGAHTRRVRYFGVFTRKDYPIRFPIPTHFKTSNNPMGLPKWNACGPLLDIKNEGKSIFGRKKPLVKNTLKRIAIGVKKFAPDVHFLMKYYGSGDNVHSIHEPLNAITTKDRHALVSIEKKHFIATYYSGCDGYRVHEISEPLKTITTANRHSLICIEKQHFISSQYSSNGNPEANNRSVDEPLAAITTNEKHQFITAHYSGQPEHKSQSLEKPLGSILTTNHHTLITAIKDGKIDFDIKMRFLTQEELMRITGFPDDYKLLGSRKDQVKMIGNAVPVKLAAALIFVVVESLHETKAGELHEAI